MLNVSRRACFFWLWLHNADLKSELLQVWYRLIHNSYLPLCRSQEQEESSLTVFSPLFLIENEGNFPSSGVSTFGLDYLANFYFGKSRLAETESRKEGEYVIKKETPWQTLKSLRFER